jgi:glycosyltransferase involved in cell wall biosynthesis
MLLREGSVCEQCVGHIPWRAVLHSCYRDSAAQSAVLASMLTMHRSLGTYRRKITRYIALNDFCRRKFVAGGLPAEKISVKPNFAAVPVPDPQSARAGALFAGRIAEEKGIHCLLDALASLPTLHVEIVGDGPERSRVSRNPHVTLRSWLSQSELFAVMRRCAYLILPSIWYENSPRVLIEAFGNGLPVIASRLGALAELVDDGRTGLLFDPASPSDLARVLRWAENHPEELREMGSRARHIYETRYSPEGNYRQLLDIYRGTIESHYLENVA